MSKFELQFDKALTRLSGFDLGEEMYDTQIKGKIDFNDQIITIVIPERVDLIGSSFIQGFFKEIVANIGISGIANKISVESTIPNIKDMIISNLS